ncbi:hypothetical protein OG709_26560 [Streptomyces sp. NBC_01267]|uniref:hypothetical protein n=1 Tax=Streptomyces sp. NBC_01267 TaxID=2903805 RepID=UPI002E311410|nr:hypothetical protein [Streptomyces sp. NBC_01267]
MHATLLAARTSPDTSAERDLRTTLRMTGAERTVALYASDMPTGFSWSRGITPQVIAWVMQGVDRLGFDDVYRSGVEAQHYRVLRLAGQVSAAARRWFRGRFPDRARLDCVEQANAMLTFRLGDYEPVSGYVGDDTFRVYRAYGDDVDEVGV